MTYLIFALLPAVLTLLALPLALALAALRVRALEAPMPGESMPGWALALDAALDDAVQCDALDDAWPLVTVRVHVQTVGDKPWYAPCRTRNRALTRGGRRPHQPGTPLANLGVSHTYGVPLPLDGLEHDAARHWHGIASARYH